MAIQIPQFTLGIAATTINNSSLSTASVDLNTGNVDAAVFHIQLGDQTSGVISTCKLEESDNNSSWSDVPNGSLAGLPISLGNGDDNTSIVMGCKRTGRKRYIRVTFASTTAQALPVTYIAAAGLNGSPMDPITPALRSLFVG
jgi:hypothetical protein